MRRTSSFARGLALAVAAAALASGASGADPANFAPAVTVAAGANPVGLLAADFDHDGKPDVATADGDSGLVEIRLGTGTGTTFRATTTYAAAAGLTDAAWGQFDASGLPDIVTVEGGAIVVAANQGIDPGDANALVFSRGTPITFAGVTFERVATADMDGDTDVDIVAVGNDTSGFGYAMVLQNDGTGAFPASYGRGAARHFDACALADVSRDGIADLIVCNRADRYVTAMRSVGAAGGFDEPTYTVVAYTPTGAAAADLSGDGVPEVLVVGYGEFQGSANEIGVTVLYNTTDALGTLIALNFLNGYQITQAPGAAADFEPAIAVADFDLDTKTDVAVANPMNRSVSVARFHPLTNPGGAFVGLALDDVTHVQVAQKPWRIAAAALETPADPTIDLVTASQAGNGVSILRNDSVPGGLPELGLASALKIQSPKEKVKIGPATVKAFRAGNRFTFFCTVPGDVDGLSVRPQYSIAPGVAEWTNVPGGIMTFKARGDVGGADLADYGPGWYATTTQVPDGQVYFRAISRAPGHKDAATDVGGGPTGYVGPIQIIPGPARLTAELTFEPQAGPGLSIRQGALIAGRVHVANTGGTEATGVYVGATIPAGCSLVSSTPATTSVTPPGIVPILVWPTGALGKKAPSGLSVPAHGSLDFDFVLRVNDDAAPGAELVCIGGAGTKKLAKEMAAAALANASTDTLRIAPALRVESQLEVAISASRGSVTPGDAVQFTLTLTNAAPFALTDLAAGVVVPVGTYLEAAYYLDDQGDPIGGQEPIVTNERRSITWTLGNLAAAGQRSVRLDVRVKFDKDSVTPVTLDDFVFTAKSAADAHAVSSVRGLGAKSLPMTGNAPPGAPAPRLLQFLVSDRPHIQDPELGTVRATVNGEEQEVVILVQNRGTAPLAAPRLFGPFPTGSNYVPGSFAIDLVPIAGDFNASSPFFDVRLPDIAPGEQVDVRYRARVRDEGAAGAPSPGGAVVVPSPSLTSESLIALTPGPAVNVRVLRPVSFTFPERSVSQGSMTLGQTLRHRWRIRNDGGDTAAGTLATVTMPVGVTAGPATLDGSPVTPTTKGRTAAIPLGTMAPGDERVVEFDSVWTATGPADENLDHVLTLTHLPAAKGAKPLFAGSVATAVTKVDPKVPHLFIAHLAPSYAQQAGSLGYTVVCGNLSAAAASKVVVSMVIPRGTQVNRTGGNPDGGKLMKTTDGADMVRWTVPSIAGHSAVALRLAVTVDAYLDVLSVTSAADCAASNAAPKFAGVVTTSITDRTLGSVNPALAVVDACRARNIPLNGSSPQALLDALPGVDPESFTVSLGGADALQFRSGALLIELGRDTDGEPQRVLAVGTASQVSPTSLGGAPLLGDEGSDYRVYAGSAEGINLAGVGCFGQTVTATYALLHGDQAITCLDANFLVCGGGNMANGAQNAPAARSLLPAGAVPVRALPATATLAAGTVFSTGGGAVLSHNGNAIVAAGGGNLIGEHGAGIVAAGGGNAVPASATSGSPIVAAGGGNVQPGGGAAIVAAGGGNIVAAGGGNIVAAGGGNIVAAGGGN